MFIIKNFNELNILEFRIHKNTVSVTSIFIYMKTKSVCVLYIKYILKLNILQNSTKFPFYFIVKEQCKQTITVCINITYYNKSRVIKIHQTLFVPCGWKSGESCFMYCFEVQIYDMVEVGSGADKGGCDKWMGRTSVNLARCDIRNRRYTEYSVKHTNFFKILHHDKCVTRPITKWIFQESCRLFSIIFITR